jgi:Holliday junction DNA helicase RuvA
MYEYIQGRVVDRNPAYVVIETNGIGYMIHISVNTFAKIQQLETGKLYTHLVVREDDMQLYGFADPSEREIFRALISVSGVGVTTARIILSSMTTGEIVRAIADGDAPLLQRIKGIGAKTAQRIIIDLRGKVAKDMLPAEKTGSLYNTNKEEALSGLVILGFPRVVAEKALHKILESEGSSLTVEQLIKHALKIL